IEDQPTGQKGRSVLNGIEYSCEADASTGLFTVSGTSYEDYVIDWFVPKGNSAGWQYEALTMDVSALNGSSGESLILDGKPGLPADMLAESDPIGLISQFRGCIMERETHEIADYDNVDLTRTLDLDIDLVPDPADPSTQWQPLLSEFHLVK